MFQNNRHSIRKPSVDYSKPNYFFITICTHKYGYYFEKYPELKEIVENNIFNLINYFPNILIKKYVIMPNHVHLILVIKYFKEKVTLGKIIASLKSKTVSDWLKTINENKINSLATIWQRNYHEHIIRNKIEYGNYCKYIEDNPSNWKNDSYHVCVK